MGDKIKVAPKPVCVQCREEFDNIPIYIDGCSGKFCSFLCSRDYQETRLEKSESVAAFVAPIEMKASNPKDRAATNRLDLTLFPDSAVAYGALAMSEGDFKYGGYNFRVVGVKSSVYVAACRRHLAKWFNGEEEDPQTGVPHLANAIACLAVLVDSLEHGNLNDDRPPTQDVAGLLKRFEEKVQHLRSTFEKDGSPARCTKKGRAA